MIGMENMFANKKMFHSRAAAVTQFKPRCDKVSQKCDNTATTTLF